MRGRKRGGWIEKDRKRQKERQKDLQIVYFARKIVIDTTMFS